MTQNMISIGRKIHHDYDGMSSAIRQILNGKAMMILLMRSTLLTVVGLVLWSSAGFAQVARVTASQRTTEKKSGDADWQIAGKGANIGSSDRFRTGKRSKADLKFRDGSLVRLGQLSYLEMRGAKQMRLTRGQLLFVALKPGRVLAGAAAAAIKGSVALIQYKNYKNSEGKQTQVAEFYLYNGVMDIITALGTVTLKPGQMATVHPDGTIVIGIAPPLQYFGGELHPDILLPPGKNPFAGSQQHSDWRDDPERIERDHNFPSFFNPEGFYDLQDDTFPKEPEPVLQLEEEGDFQPFFRTFAAGPPSEESTDQNSQANFGSGSSGLGSAQLRSPFFISSPLRLAQAEIAKPNDAQTTLEVAEDTVIEEGEFDLDATAAYNHLGEAEFDDGNMLGGDVALLGAASNKGSYAYGARLHGFYARDKWFLDGAYTPLGVRSRFEDDDDKDTRNFSAISDLSMTYSDQWGEAQVGRQRFLSGPTQATLYGSLVRAGGREIMDAVRVSPRIGEKYSLELAYLHDAFPRRLPYLISGSQGGYYGRLATYQSYGNFGLNVLKYTDSEVDDTTGATIDFSLPVLRDKVEFYGEVGRDPFRRRMTSFGITLPYVYEKTGWDIFFETAKLRDSRAADAPPTEYSIRAYKRLSEQVNLVAALSHFSGQSTRVLVGFSIGARTSR